MLSLVKHKHPRHAPRRKVRILCLHGKGTNAAIMKSQTRAVCSHLDDLCEFVFVDGLHECEPYPGADQFYPGPFYAWYDGNDRDSILRAEQHILHLASTDSDEGGLGPFDGIAGFSQGGALAASIATRHCARHAPSSPFKFAIFLCTGLPLGWDHLGLDAPSGVKTPPPSRSDAGSEMDSGPDSDSDGGGGWSTRFLPSDEDLEHRRGSVSSTTSSLSSSSSSSFSSYNTSSSTWHKSEPVHHLPSYTHPHPDHLTQTSTITIPTAHIIGKRDSVNTRGRHLFDRSCPRAGRVLHEHPSGHTIPRTTATTKGIEAAIRATVDAAMAVGDF